MKKNKIISRVPFAVTLVLLASSACQLFAQSPASSENKSSGTPQWNLQVAKVDSGEVNLDPAFRAAIYENLVGELARTKRFKHVFRDGDRNTKDLADLLILKTTVLKFTAGSETRRAVTTVSGATKLNVRSQLCRSDGTVVTENTVEGDVRFFGGNLRATHNLAKNIANKMKEAKLPEAAAPGKA